MSARLGAKGYWIMVAVLFVVMLFAMHGQG